MDKKNYIRRCKTVAKRLAGGDGSSSTEQEYFALREEFRQLMEEQGLLEVFKAYEGLKDDGWDVKYPV